MMPFTYKATPSDVALWREYGALRFRESRKIGAQYRKESGGVVLPLVSRVPGVDVDVLGVAGEHAVAIFLGLGESWRPSVNTFKAVPDVAGYEVRCAGMHRYRLVIRPPDPPDRPFVHATVDASDWPTVKVWGWITGKEGKRQAWERNPGGYLPAYFVPTEALHPVDTMKWQGALFA